MDFINMRKNHTLRQTPLGDTYCIAKNSIMKTIHPLKKKKPIQNANSQHNQID